MAMLRLVRSASPTAGEAPRFEQIQSHLVPISDRVFCVATSDALNEGVLRGLLKDVRPTLLLDFRMVPRFDFGRLNRARAFHLFSESGVDYVDARGDASTDIVARCKTLCAERPARSVLVLLDAGSDYQRLGIDLIGGVRTGTTSPWELLLVGPTEPSHLARDVLFISHANPEDNEFVVWLQTQLIRLGYETWSDLSKLRGGELIWDRVEDVIRNRAVRVIVVASRVAMQKAGVLDEISLAVSVERSNGLPGFVIPLRVDATPFGDFRANLARKNILDFSQGWASGLGALGRTLSEDRIPRGRNNEGTSLSQWWSDSRKAPPPVRPGLEQLIANRLQVLSVPKKMYLYDGIPSSTSNAGGLVPINKMWLSYRSPEELHLKQVSGLTLSSTLDAASLYRGAVSISSYLSEIERARLFHRVLNRQWETFLAERGLLIYDQSGSYPTPYIPDGLIPKNTAFFTDAFGVQRRRILVGFSVKRGLHWHLGPTGYFVGVKSPELSLKLRIIFSEDGQARWPSTEKIRTMRRTFCKSWWNDRWRDLQSALLSWLAEGRSEIVVFEGHAGKLSLSSTPRTFESPVTIVESVESSSSEDLAPSPFEADDLLDEVDLDLDEDRSNDETAAQGEASR